ncbi:transcription termination factor NusA [Neisseria sp. Ec49-e6-T10]|uniref:transcription termination factor NusA n=1 Tax=Neisseria sp. Ec49-e6-T10 TaxID=3140744 RepID=UPI003EB9CD9D
MSREILLLVDALASEKNVSQDVVFSALESALASAAKKKFDKDEMIDVRVEIDRDTGDYQNFRRWLVVEEQDLLNDDTQMILADARLKDPNIQVGEYLEEQIENVEFGRIGAQTAKQVILQRIRDAEREKLLNEFLQRKEQLISGTVKRSERHGVVIECGKLEAFLPRENMIPKENLRSGDRVRAYLAKVDYQGSRPQVILTRTSREFLAKLFEMEVPEIEEGLLEIKEVARDPGLRAKMAVKASDARIDPQGTCIGVRGSRVNAVSNELAGERIDIVLWSPETAQFVINALSPAEVTRILIDEDSHSVDVVVAEDQLALAIGRNGQNVRLAAELTGWNLNILTVAEAEERHQAEDARVAGMFESQLNIDADMANLLVQEGFVSLEEVAYVPINEMLEIEGIDEEMVNTLRNRARDAILTLAIASEEKIEKVDEDLKSLEGVDGQMLRDLAEAEINTKDDLAELSVDELIEITGITEDEAKEIIMKARAHWFEQ